MNEKPTSIYYPNTASSNEQSNFDVRRGHEFEFVEKNGEMAPIRWIRVTKEGKVVAEIKESVCDLYFA